MKEYRCAICGILIERESPENGESVGEYTKDESKLCNRCKKNCDEGGD